MSTNNGATPAATATRPPPQPMMFMVPPPITYVVQLNDGYQLSITPPPRIVPIPVGSLDGSDNMAGLMSTLMGLWGDGGSMDALLNDLFQRSQAESHGPPPTSKQFLDTLPTKQWSSELEATEKFVECPICLDEYTTGDRVITLPCSHSFHKDCGLHWLVDHNVCPTCRHQLPTQQQEETAKPHVTEPATASAAAPPPAASATPPPAVHTGEPDAEPEAEPDMDTEVQRQRIRRQLSPQAAPQRTVRRRLASDLTLPGAVEHHVSPVDMAAADLDRWMDEEATQFVKEEATKRQLAEDISFDDVDIDDLLRS